MTLRQRTQVDLARKDGLVVSIGRIQEDAVRSAYRRWAPVYDWTIGRLLRASQKHAVAVINSRRGDVLEVGVGTGLSLADYGRHLNVIGIDLSPEMLDRARDRVVTQRLDHVVGLYEMDAGNLAFPDNSFDVVTAMFVITTVPEPERVMRELARVAKPEGEVILVNHFSQVKGVRGWVEQRLAPLAAFIGWRSVFDLTRVMVCDDLDLIERRALRPWGIFTMLRFSKRAITHSKI